MPSDQGDSFGSGDMRVLPELPTPSCQTSIVNAGCSSAKPECAAALRGGFASTATAFALMGAVVLLCLGLGVKYRRAKRKAAWQAAAARALELAVEVEHL